MNRTEHLLTILSEECSEVIKEVSKSLRFGLNNCNPNVILIEADITNSERITKEIVDITAILEMLYEEGIIKQPHVLDIYEKKKNIQKYIKCAEELGTLNNEI